MYGDAGAAQTQVTNNSIVSALNFGAGNEWKAIGITLLVIVTLGMFDKTRAFAIGAAVVLGGLMVLHKVNGR